METEVSLDDLAANPITDSASRDAVTAVLGDEREVTIVSQITSRSLLLAVIPLVVLGTITTASFFLLNRNASDRLDESRDQLIEESIGAHLEEEAELLLVRLDNVVAERFDDVIDWSRSNEVVGAALETWPLADRLTTLSVEAAESQAPSGGLLDTSGASSDYLAGQVSDRPIFAEVFFTDANGFNIGSTNQTTDFVQRDEIWWQAAWNSRAYLGELEFDASAGVASFEIAIRIDDPETQRPIGVMKAVIDATGVQAFADEFAASEGGAVQVTVITLDGSILAETETNHNVTRLANPDVELTGDRLSAFTRARVDLDDDGFYALEDLVVGFARTEDSRFIERLRAEIPNHNWIVLVEQPAEQALAPLSGVEAVRADVGSLARNLTVLVVLVIAVAVAATSYVSRIMAGRITDPINRLKDEAHRVADEELPQLVESLRDPDSTEQAPKVHPIDLEVEGEVGELADAFNSVRATAVGLAAEQAIARRQVTNMLRNLGRRNQQLIGRQLEFIDQLEQRESDPDILENLFRLDSLASRMRRNAESLVVLAGDSELRTGEAPTPIEDVIRGAISEVEDYERVQITAAEPAIVQGHVVNDLTHLLAEIIENATNFSPPGTPVAVIGTGGLDGSYSISVVDQGLGMSRRKMVEANARIRRPNITDDPESSYLGLYVIGRLAARHHIDARLVESATEGVTAKLTLPASCLVGFEALDAAPSPDEAADLPTASRERLAPVAEEVDITSLTPRVRRTPSAPADAAPGGAAEMSASLDAPGQEERDGVRGGRGPASHTDAGAVAARGNDSVGGPAISNGVDAEKVNADAQDPSSHPDRSPLDQASTSLELPESWIIPAPTAASTAEAETASIDAGEAPEDLREPADAHRPSFAAHAGEDLLTSDGVPEHADIFGSSTDTPVADSKANEHDPGEPADADVTEPSSNESAPSDDEPTVPSRSGRGSLSDLIRSAARGARPGADGSESSPAGDGVGIDRPDLAESGEPGVREPVRPAATADVLDVPDVLDLDALGGTGERRNSTVARVRAGEAVASPDTRSVGAEPTQTSDEAHTNEDAPAGGAVTAPVRSPAAAPEERGTVQVRQRTSKRPTGEVPDIGGDGALPSRATPSGRARADAVRDKLTRFTQAVNIGREASSVDVSERAQERAAAVREGLTALTEGIERGRAEATEATVKGED